MSTCNYTELQAKRIENVMNVIEKCPAGTWAHNHWSAVLACLTREWRRTAKLCQK